MMAQLVAEDGFQAAIEPEGGIGVVGLHAIDWETRPRVARDLGGRALRNTCRSSGGYGGFVGGT